MYSTCTLAPEENEGVITDFLAKNPSASVLPIIFEKLSVPVFPGIKTDGKVEFHPDLSKAVRFYPSELTEGFFICLITKK